MRKNKAEERFFFLTAVHVICNFFEAKLIDWTLKATHSKINWAYRNEDKFHVHTPLVKIKREKKKIKRKQNREQKSFSHKHFNLGDSKK